MKLVSQKSAAPTRKVMAAGLAGALVTVLVGVLNVFNVEVPAEVSSALVTVISFVAAYFTKSKASE